MKDLKQAKEIRRKKMNILVGILLSLVIIGAFGVYFWSTNNENMEGVLNNPVGQIARTVKALFERQDGANVLFIVSFILVVTIFLYVGATKRNKKDEN